MQVTRDTPMQFSDIRKFVVTRKREPAEPPRLLAPLDDDKVETSGGDAPVNLTWSAGPQAKSFVVEVAKDIRFSGAEVLSAMKPGMDVMRPTGTYFWRVKALDAAGEESPFSAARKFDVTLALQAITLATPLPDARVKNFKVTFTWQPIDRCTTYELAVAQSNTMDHPLRKVSTTSIQMQVELDDEDTYFWSVQCATNDGRVIKSSPRSFRITIDG